MIMRECGCFLVEFEEDQCFCVEFEDESQFCVDFGEIQKVSTGDYNDLNNKPSINEVVLKGNKTFEDLGDKTLTNFEIKEIFDRVFEGGQ